MLMGMSTFINPVLLLVEFSNFRTVSLCLCKNFNSFKKKYSQKFINKLKQKVFYCCETHFVVFSSQKYFFFPYWTFLIDRKLSNLITERNQYFENNSSFRSLFAPTPSSYQSRKRSINIRLITIQKFLSFFPVTFQQFNSKLHFYWNDLFKKN